MTAPVGAANGTQPPPTVPANKRNDEMDKDAFLKLLVAQLKYQDPLSPSDPAAFMTQTAQFTQVEKLDQIASQGEATNRALGLSAASGLIGRNVSWLDADGKTVTGKATAANSTIDGVTLTVGDSKISLDAVTGIS